MATAKLASAVKAAADAARLGPCKMALIVRADLGMSKGKMCAQAAHAAVEAYRCTRGDSATSRQKAALRAWELAGSTKIALRAGSEAELLALHDAARTAGLTAALIRDAGHTQVDPGTLTVLAVGPGPAAEVDAVTGALKLL